MRMIRDCLEVTEAQRAELEKLDRRPSQRNARFDDDEISEAVGNRKQRRRQGALERQGKA